MTTFWKTWLSVWCWIVALFGALLTGAASEVTDGPMQMLLAVMNPAAGSTQFDDVHRFAIALTGAVTLGWGLTLSASFDAAQQLGAAAGATWRKLTASVLVWFVVDSSLSIATGFALNAASNTLLLIGYLVPLFASGVLTREGAKHA